MKIQIKQILFQLNGILTDQPRLGALSLHSVQVIFPSTALKMMMISGNNKLEPRLFSENVIVFMATIKYRVTFCLRQIQICNGSVFMAAIKYWVTFCLVPFCNLVTFRLTLRSHQLNHDTKVHKGSIGRHDMFALNKSQWTRTSSLSVITNILFQLLTFLHCLFSNDYIYSMILWLHIFYFSRGQLGQNRALPQLLQWSDYTPKSYHPTMSCHPTHPTRNKHVSKAKRLDMNLLHCKKRTSVDLKQMWGQKKWCCPNKVDSPLKKCKQKFLPHPDVGERPDSERNRKFHINRIQSLVN